MPVLPIPMIIALLLGGLLLHRLVARDTHVTLLALIAVCAVQAAINALVHYYGFLDLRMLQAVLATCIPPIAWFAFAWASGGEVSPRKVAMHVAGPVLAIVLLFTKPVLLDTLIASSFAGYGLAMLLRMRRGEDSLLHSSLDGGAMPLLAWRVVALALIASAGVDIAISLGLAFGQPAFLNWLPSIISSLSLLSLGVLSLLPAVQSKRGDDSDVSVSEEDAARDQAIVERLDDLMKQHQPYLDPDLTLARLARKLVLPVKQLSTAINRVKGENVSKYINGLRIEEAGRLLQLGKPVTSVIYDSGFNTKSNFNREFLRVTGKSPTDWLSEQRKASG